MRKMQLEEVPNSIETPPPMRAPRGPGRLLLVLGVAALLVAAVVYLGIRPRLRAQAALVHETDRLALPDVAVVHPTREPPAQFITLPADLDAYTDSPIYARTSGYLLHWYADIGAHVKAGQLIADIDTPEVDQELEQAQADLATAQANLRLSQITDSRYQGLLAQDGVSRQDADNAAGDLAAKQSMVQSASANVKRLQSMEAFKRIVAPFDGIITARNVDIGALINAGAGSRELFHIAATSRIRVYVKVPQEDAAALTPGLSANLTVPQLSGRQFAIRLDSTAGAIDTASRTLLAQFLADNPTGALLPGAYAEVRLPVPPGAAACQVPVSALLFRTEGPRLVTVEHGVAHLRQVVVGRDYGSAIEIVSGLSLADWVVTNPPDAIVDGEPVNATPRSGATAGAGR